MSVRYKQYVLPDPGDLLFRPSRAQLQGVLNGLSELGWLRPEHALTESERRLYTLPSQAPLRLEVPTTALLHLWLAGGPPGQYPDEFAEGDRFGPSYCEDVTIYDSPVLAILPPGMDSAELLCTSCSRDIYPAVSSSAGLAERPELRKLLGNGFSVAPERCPSCDQVVDLKRAAMELGVDRTDSAPFAHFILVFHAVHAPDKPVQLHPDLLSMLSRQCGVPFRDTGRFE